MPDWIELLQRHHSATHPEDDFELKLGPPASDEQLQWLSNELEIKLPEEFCSLYACCDGVGIVSGTILWSFLPLRQVPRFACDIRDWFQETHPLVARRFVPSLIGIAVTPSDISSKKTVKCCLTSTSLITTIISLNPISLGLSS